VRDHARIRAPKRLLMGPWKHVFPDAALEGPAPALREMERWWERWLREKDDGGAGEPPATLFVQGHDAGWRQDAAWPPPGASRETWRLDGDGALRRAESGDARPAAGGATRELAHDPTIGLGTMGWDPWTTALDPNIPWDLGPDDARSLAFDSAPLPAPLELRGSPRVTLDVAVSAAPAHVVVRLADVAPGGRATLVTLGWLDLALREGPGRRLPVEPGARYRVTVPLRATAYRLAPGHRLRLAVATADFPRIWPTPRPFALTLHPDGVAVELPVARATAPTAGPPGGGAAPNWGPPQPEALRGPADLGGGQRWETRRDLGEDLVTLDATKEEHLRLDAITRYHGIHRYAASVPARRPDLCRMQSTTEIVVERPVTHTELTVTTVTTTHAVSVTATITVDRTPYWTRTWSRSLGPDRPEGAPPPSTR
jgi:hypothetical protein